jgi:hypothetical protein
MEYMDSMGPRALNAIRSGFFSQKMSMEPNTLLQSHPPNDIPKGFSYMDFLKIT